MRLRSFVVGMVLLGVCAAPVQAAPVKLTVVVEGTGSVWSGDQGHAIDCPDRCNVSVKSGASVRLHAKGAAAWKLDAWSDRCVPLKSDPKACTIMVAGPTTVSAEFVPQPNTDWRRAETGAALILFFLALILAKAIWTVRGTTPPDVRGGIVNGLDNRWSTSKVSVVIWTFAVLFAFLTLLILYGTRVFPGSLQNEYLALLGIPAAAAVGAKGITSSLVEAGAAAEVLSRYPDERPAWNRADLHR